MSLLETNLSGFDLSRFAPDGPLPEIPPTEGIQATRERLIEWAASDNLSIRELALRHDAQRTGNIGADTAENVAEVITHWRLAQPGSAASS